MSPVNLCFLRSESIVSTVVFDKVLFIATSHAVYKLTAGKRLELLEVDTDIASIIAASALHPGYEAAEIAEAEKAAKKGNAA